MGKGPFPWTESDADRISQAYWVRLLIDPGASPGQRIRGDVDNWTLDEGFFEPASALPEKSNLTHPSRLPHWDSVEKRENDKENKA
jgi:hypothetical protein